jgi:hypothetical protein
MHKRGLFRNVVHTKSYEYLSEGEISDHLHTMAYRFEEMGEYNKQLQAANQRLGGSLDALNIQLAQVFTD